MVRCSSAFLVVLLVCVGCGMGGEESDASLSDLTTSIGTLSPAFDPDNPAYTVDVGRFAASVTVTPTASEEGATIEVEGVEVASGGTSQPVALSSAPTPVSVEVIAPDGLTRSTYTVIFLRASTALQQAYLKASNTDPSDTFGHTVAISGDTIVVGAWLEESNATGVDGDGSDDSLEAAGAAYVFVRVAGVWMPDGYLKASNTDAGDNFGQSVAVSGDTIVVGAPLEDSESNSINGDEGNSTFKEDSGAAYVFVRSGGTWTQQAYLKANKSDAGDRFGHAVAIDADLIVVGATGEDSADTQADNSASDAGAVYVFERTTGTWSDRGYVKAAHPTSNDRFGHFVGISGETLLIGALAQNSDARGVNGDETNTDAPQSGAAYVFVRSGLRDWAQQAFLKASNSEAGDFFGVAGAISGDTVAVGARFEDSGATGVGGDESDNGTANAGAVYVFVRSGSTWSQQAYVKASNPDMSDDFGFAVGLSGDLLVVGANGEDSAATGLGGDQSDNTRSLAGAAYVFTRSGTTWSQEAYVKASNTEGDAFGLTAAASGDTFVVGATLERSNATGVNGDQSNNDAPNAGAAYVFR